MQTCVFFLSTYSLSLLLVANSQFRFQPPKKEGEKCGSLGNAIWICQKESDCSVLSTLILTGRRVICSRNGGIDIVCCPQRPSVPNRISDSISERKCMEYQYSTCKSQNRILIDSYNGGDEKPFPGVLLEEEEDTTLDRVKREDEDSTEDLSITLVSIFGGTKANPGEHPHSALIGFGDENKIFWKCGGTLISERYVLSAAHCTNTRRSGPARWVRLGDIDYKDNSDKTQVQQLEIIEHYVHHGYKDPLYYNDIVLFRLDRDVVFDDYVAPACLYTSLGNPPGSAIASGWGKVETQLHTTRLMKVGLDFVSNEDCKKRVSNNDNLPKGIDSQTMICAWKLGKDTCVGDSGGPLILADKGDKCLAQVVGITSFGPSECEATVIPGTYVRVAHFVPWIESIVWPVSKKGR